ncbi:MAG: CHAP domain-containing protein [Candidatus Roizmanbacteria bacterium]|nr:CHAP domain-containing protein [Candidatus Roizmanbacteria bacterium]
MFRKLALGVLIFIAVSIGMPSSLFAQKSAGEILDHTNETLKPNSVQQKEEADNDNPVGWICRLFGNPLICSGYQTHTVYSPNSKIPQDMTEQDIENAIALLDELETGDIAGTQSAQVLAGSENIFARLLSLTGLFTDKETASTTRHTWPSGISNSLGTDPEGAVADKMARGILMPQALQLGTFKITPIPTEGLPGGPTGTPSDPNISGSLRVLIKQAGDAFSVPWQVVEATLHIEGEHAFGLSPEEVIEYQQPGAEVPTNCDPNFCSAAGPMQMTTGIDDTGSTSCSVCLGPGRTCPNAWSGYENAVTEKTNDGRTPNVCNLKDSLYGGAKKLKNDSKTGESDIVWDKIDVTKAAQAYYGSCTPCNVAKAGTGAYFACQRLGKTYCDYVWDYYQQNLNVVVEPAQPTVPPGTGGSVAQADQLVSSIRSVCRYGGTAGRVHQLNVGCLGSVVPTLTSNAKGALEYSATEFVNLQCVGLVRGMKWQLQNDPLAGGGHAIDFASDVPQGYRYVRKGNGFPRVHDLLIWDMGNEYGHIAYVTEVYDAGSVEVMEANWDPPGFGAVNTRTVYLADPKVIGWITRQ